MLDTLKTTTPLVTKVLLTWLEESYIYHRLTPEERASAPFKQPKGIGYGIGVAFALFVMQGAFTSSWSIPLLTDHFKFVEVASLARILKITKCFSTEYQVSLDDEPFHAM